MADISTDPTIITAEQKQRQLEQEYGTWVATEPISIDGVPAFRAGDPVPVSHVERYGLDKAGYVRPAKAAELAEGEPKAKPVKAAEAKRAG